MNFKEILLEVLLEGKIDDVLDKHTTIPHDVKQDYLSKIPDNNAQHLDWVLQQHTKGNIKTEHNIHEILSTFNKVKDKLPKKQISQYKTVDALHTAVLPHADGAKQSTNEKSTTGTETLYNSPTMTIKQHHNYESAINAANLPDNNHRKEKAGWCISVGNGGGAAHYSRYTANGFHPVYTIEHQHPDGSSSKHMLVYDYNKSQAQQELRTESDHRPGSTDYQSTRPDLLDHYGKEHSEIMKTPISHLFTEEGREQYKKEVVPVHENLKNILSNIPVSGMSDDEYMHNFKEGQKKQQGIIHNTLAKAILTTTQLNHLVEHGNEGSKHDIAGRNDLTDEHTQRLANTNNMLVHHQLLSKHRLDADTFNTIVKKAHAEVIPTLIMNSHFDATHIEPTLSKKISNTNLSSIVSSFHPILKPHHISALVHKGENNTHYELVNTIPNKLSSTDIDAIIKGTSSTSNPFFDRSSSSIHRKLISSIADKLEPHHIKALMDKGDVDTHVELIDNAYEKLEPEHIKTLTDSNNEDIRTALNNRIHNGLNAQQIKALIYHGNSKTHKQLIDKIPNKLEPSHITALINNSVDSVHGHLIRSMSDKLQPEHISNLIDKGNFSTHSTIMRRLDKKLDKDHITALINTADQDVHDNLLSSFHKKLTPTHIGEIIEKGEPKVHNRLIDNLSDKLNSTHIKSIIDKNNYYINTEIISKMQDKLDRTHVKALIDTDDKDIYPPIIQLMSDKLEPQHISDMINKGDTYTHTRLLNLLSNKLEPQHISDMIKKGHKYTRSELLRILPHKLDRNHINSLLFGDDNDHDINRAYSNLPLESKKAVMSHVKQLSNIGDRDYLKFNNVLADINPPIVEHFNNVYFRNNAFEQLLKESLIRSETTI